jgi:hypothetical protein
MKTFTYDIRECLIEALACSIVESLHIDFGGYQACVWLLVAISTAVCDHVRRRVNTLLAVRAAAVALPFKPRHDPAHFRLEA